MIDAGETTPAQHAWHQLQATCALLTMAIAHDLAPVGITPLQLNTLHALHTSGGAPTIGQLAHVSALEPQSITMMMNRVEQHGWVRRMRDQPDHRVIRVELTDTGRAKLTAALPVEAAVIQAVFRHLPSETVTALTGLLEQLSPRAPP